MPAKPLSPARRWATGVAICTAVMYAVGMTKGIAVLPLIPAVVGLGLLQTTLRSR